MRHFGRPSPPLMSAAARRRREMRFRTCRSLHLSSLAASTVVRVVIEASLGRLGGTLGGASGRSLLAAALLPVLVAVAAAALVVLRLVRPGGASAAGVDG